MKEEEEIVLLLFIYFLHLNLIGHGKPADHIRVKK